MGGGGGGGQGWGGVWGGSLGSVPAESQRAEGVDVLQCGPESACPRRRHTSCRPFAESSLAESGPLRSGPSGNSCSSRPWPALPSLPPPVTSRSTLCPCGSLGALGVISAQLGLWVCAASGSVLWSLGTRFPSLSQEQLRGSWREGPASHGVKAPTQRWAQNTP